MFSHKVYSDRNINLYYFWSYFKISSRKAVFPLGFVLEYSYRKLSLQCTITPHLKQNTRFISKMHNLHYIVSYLGWKKDLQLSFICFQKLTMAIEDQKSICLWCKIALQYPEWLQWQQKEIKLISLRIKTKEKTNKSIRCTARGMKCVFRGCHQRRKQSVNLWDTGSKPE